MRCEQIAPQHPRSGPAKLTECRKQVFNCRCYAAVVDDHHHTPVPAILTYDRSARRELGSYALAAVGLVFAYAGGTIDPASNCSESGECAPWLVPIAFVMGVAAFFAGIGMLWANPRWGSRVDLTSRVLIWWNDQSSQGEHHIPLDSIGTIRIKYGIEERNVFLLDREGQPIPFPRDEVTPYARREDWARTVAALAPHIKVEIA